MFFDWIRKTVVIMTMSTRSCEWKLIRVSEELRQANFAFKEYHLYFSSSISSLLSWNSS
jgi:hypothetical protein